MITNRGKLLAAAAVVLLTAAACSSSSKSSSSGGGGGGGGKAITVGVITDVTGPAASGNKTYVEGVKAGIKLAAREGYNIKYVVGDSTTSPATVQTAAQKLVQQDHVPVVLGHSAVLFGATPYLTSQNVPVIGFAEDGPEWLTSKNMFSVGGYTDTTKVTTTLGKFFKMMGVTKAGALGYSISPSSAESAKGAIQSAKAVGIKEGYLNANFPFGSTNVQPVALAMKSGGVDGFTATVDPNTSFALISALRQNGVNIKAASLPTGYGGDTLQAGPGALQAAQNVFFSLNYEPVEMNTSATQQFLKDLRASGTTTEPTYAEYNGYTSVGLLVRALKQNGGNTSSASLIQTLSSIHNWDALGLWGGRTLDLSDRAGSPAGVDNCGWYTKLVGQKFELVKGADPVCGEILKGVKVSS